MARWPYNTDRWQRLRRAQLIAEPWCRYCDELGLVTVATTVDHVIPVREDPGKAFDPTNLQSLCASCHSSIKQAEEAGEIRKGCGVDGVPFRGWE